MNGGPFDHLHLVERQAREKALAFAREAERVTADGRQATMDYAWLLCRCRPWFSWDAQEPPQAGCEVHGTVMVTSDGRVI